MDHLLYTNKHKALFPFETVKWSNVYWYMISLTYLKCSIRSYHQQIIVKYQQSSFNLMKILKEGSTKNNHWQLLLTYNVRSSTFDLMKLALSFDKSLLFLICNILNWYIHFIDMSYISWKQSFTNLIFILTRWMPIV